MKRSRKIIAKQHFTEWRKRHIQKDKKAYKIVDPHFRRFRATRHIQHLPISKYGNKKKKEQVEQEEGEVEEEEGEEGEEGGNDGEEEESEEGSDGQQGGEEGEEQEVYDGGDEEDDTDERSARLATFTFKTVNGFVQKKQEASSKKQFVPFLKKFLNLSIKERAKRITDKHVYDFMRLAQAIINKKIKMNLSETDFDQLKELMLGMDSDDRKLVLIEDFRLSTLFKRAIRILESDLKLPQRSNERKRRSKKTSYD